MIPTMRPYNASASAKIKIRIIPTKSFGCCAFALCQNIKLLDGASTMKSPTLIHESNTNLNHMWLCFNGLYKRVNKISGHSDDVHLWINKLPTYKSMKWRYIQYDAQHICMKRYTRLQMINGSIFYFLRLMAQYSISFPKPLHPLEDCNW